MANKEKKTMTFVKRNPNEPDGYEYVFGDNTHKMTSTKSENVISDDDEFWKMKFEQLIDDLEKYCYLKISLTPSYRVKAVDCITLLPKPKRKSKLKKEKCEKSEGHDNDVSKQNESISA